MHTDRFAELIADIEAHPETWDQGWWHCGTTHCLAGLAEIRAGLAPKDFKIKKFSECEYSFERVDSIQQEFETRKNAMEWLGLTGAQAKYLFSDDRTLKDFQAFAASGGVVPEGW